jgi:hypothetical protein
MNTVRPIEFARVKQAIFPLRVSSRSQADHNNIEQSTMSDSIQRTTTVDTDTDTSFSPSIVTNPKPPLLHHNPYQKRPRQASRENAQEGEGKPKHNPMV